MTVAKTISLPKDLLKFGQKRAKEIAKETESEPNLSLYVRKLILRDMESEISKSEKKAA